jgi:hypothetical protein
LLNPTLYSARLGQEQIMPNFNNASDHSPFRKVDFREVKALMRGYEGAILYRLLPHGKKQGHEYVALNPKRHDRKLGSFRINLHSYKWADFATDDRGGDLISLWAYVRGVNNLEAAKEILSLLGK